MDFGCSRGKLLTNEQLQALIDKGENQIEVVNSDEKFESNDLSYTKAVIGETITFNDSEQKVLGLRWDGMEDVLNTYSMRQPDQYHFDTIKMTSQA